MIMKDKYDGLIFYNVSKPGDRFKLKLSSMTNRYDTYNKDNEKIIDEVCTSTIDNWFMGNYAPLKWQNGHTICTLCNPFKN